jgi:hypothetical protein
VDTVATLAIPALGILAAVTFCYACLCAVAPFKRCRRCHGAGYVRAILGRGRPCRPCKTTGLTLRTGRRLHNHWRRLRAGAR